MRKKKTAAGTATGTGPGTSKPRARRARKPAPIVVDKVAAAPVVIEAASVPPIEVVEVEVEAAVAPAPALAVPDPVPVPVPEPLLCSEPDEVYQSMLTPPPAPAMAALDLSLVRTRPVLTWSFRRWHTIGIAVVIASVIVLRIGTRSHTGNAQTAPPAPVVVTPGVAAISLPPPPAVPALPLALVDDGRTRVVIISEDGMRADVIGEHLTPRHAALIRQGMVARRAYTVRPSDTLPSHASMLSGFSVAQHGFNFDNFRRERGFLTVPTVFSLADDAGMSTAMIVGKKKLRHIARPGTVDHYERPSFFCNGVSKRAAAYFLAERPDVMFVHFADPDDAGHGSGWMTPRYLRAVRESDRCLSVVLDAIDKSGLAATTLVIVTADHGGHGRSHSTPSMEVDKRIPWIVRGPSIAPGTVLDATVATVDTAATALAALRVAPGAGMTGISRLPVAPAK